MAHQLLDVLDLFEQLPHVDFTIAVQPYSLGLQLPSSIRNRVSHHLYAELDDDVLNSPAIRLATARKL